MNTMPFKFLPLRKSDFQNQVGYNVKTHLNPTFSYLYSLKKCSYAELLNKLGRYLFPSFDYSNITRSQLIELNKLIQLGKQIMDKYIPEQDQGNINLATFPVYLFRAVREFNITHVSPKRLNAARSEETNNNHSRKLKYLPRVFLHSGICPDYLPRQVKSQTRDAFNQEYGVYPENIYIAVVFYLMPYVLGIRPSSPGCNIWLLRLVLNNINSTLHNKQCGTAPKKLYKIYTDKLFESFEQDMISGKYRGQSALEIKLSIRTSHKLQDNIVSRFNKKYNLKRITDFYK